MRDIKCSIHATQQYSIRTGKYMSVDRTEQLKDAIERAEELKFSELKDKGFTLLKRVEGDTYLVWYEESIKEDVCGIVSKDNVLKTVLTKQIYSLHRKPMKVRYDSYEKSKPRLH